MDPKGSALPHIPTEHQGHPWNCCLGLDKTQVVTVSRSSSTLLIMLPRVQKFQTFKWKYDEKMAAVAGIVDQHLIKRCQVFALQLKPQMFAILRGHQRLICPVCVETVHCSIIYFTVPQYENLSDKQSVKSEDRGLLSPSPFPVFHNSFLIREPWLLSSTWWSRYSLWMWSITRQCLVSDVNKSYSLTHRKIPFSEAPPRRPKLLAAAAPPLTTGTETRAPAAWSAPPLRNTSKTSDCFVVCLCFFCFFLWPLMPRFWLLTYVQTFACDVLCYQTLPVYCNCKHQSAKRDYRWKLAFGYNLVNRLQLLFIIMHCTCFINK